jgi:hypothetical protein
MSLKTRKQRCSEYFSFGKPDQKQLEFLPFWRKNSKLLERNYNYWREARRPLYVGTACYSNCESHQDYKGIFSDRSTGVFNGREKRRIQKNNNILSGRALTLEILRMTLDGWAVQTWDSEKEKLY